MKQYVFELRENVKAKIDVISNHLMILFQPDHENLLLPVDSKVEEYCINRSMEILIENISRRFIFLLKDTQEETFVQYRNELLSIKISKKEKLYTLETTFHGDEKLYYCQSDILETALLSQGLHYTLTEHLKKSPLGWQ